MPIKVLKFDLTDSSEFISTLRERVNSYFVVNKINRFGNRQMHLKTAFVIGLYVVPYSIILSDMFQNPAILFFLWTLMAFGMAGIGLAIMHDANHGAYSKDKNVNHYLGMLVNLLGVDQQNWKMQHNVLHHTFTNIEGFDTSLDAGNLLRFSPHQKRLKHHRFQHYYAWILYALQTLILVTITDFMRLNSYDKDELTRSKSSSYTTQLIKLILWKLFYFGYVLFLPMYVLSIPWWWTLSLFFIMHLIAGFILSCIFLIAHIMPDCDYPLPTDAGNVENQWLVHQLATSCNFVTSNTLFSWYIGGLNYQVEHHLFPNICHVHYKGISKIVKQTAQEYCFPYNQYMSFYDAMKYHTKMMKMLGNYDHPIGVSVSTGYK